jgi:uncharacterized spore protein YtfJ
VDLNEMVTATRDAMTVRRVFGEPIERDGVTLIPAAVVRGGMGGGGGRRSGEGDEPGLVDSGEGGGFGVVAVPVGMYSVRDGRVRWHPATNVNLIVCAATAVTITWLLGRPRARGTVRRAARS